MTEDQLSKVISEIDSLGLRSAHFLWHGGEPLVAGLPFFKKGLQMQQDCRTRFLNSVQTNATLVDRSYAEFFAENSFSVGVSIDGYTDVQNLNRPFRNGRASSDAALKGLKHLHNTGITPSCISVVSKHTESHKYFEFLSRLGIRSFALKPSVSEWEGSIPLKDYTRFVKEVYSDWLELDDPGLICREFMGYAENLLGGENTTAVCSQSGLCGYFAMIDIDGNVYPCDELVSPQHLWGNVNETSLQTILSSDRRREFLEMVDKRKDHCREFCEAFVACHGGCTGCHEFYTDLSYCTHVRSIVSAVNEWIAD